MGSAITSEFGTWLRARRRSLDLTRDKLAACAGCSPATIEKVENGERKPSRQIAELLARCLKIPESLTADFVQFARGGASIDGLLTEHETPHPKPGGAIALPSAPTEFIGRAAEVEAVRDLLRSRGVRLVTIIGPPGIGKTRLSLEAASGLGANFQDGVYFVPLSGLTSANFVIPTIASVLGVRAVQHQTLLESVVSALRGKHVLLVLDNFEQLLPAASDIAALLAGAADLKALVSSRAALRVYGEHTFSVPPMTLPDSGAQTSEQELLEYEAVSLFVKRARAANREFALSAENASQVVAICRRLDALPLAIELAANRARVLTAGQILDRLGASLDLLAGGASDLPSRQQSLRGAIGWGYDVLAPREQQLFRVMSVFVGGCTLDALEKQSLAEGPGELGLVDSITTLVDSSLVRQQSGVVGARFSMLDTIAEYAMEQLIANREVAQARHDHAHYFLSLVEKAEPNLQGGDQAGWLAQLDVEQANIRSAYDYFREVKDGLSLARLVSSLRRFWYLRGDFLQGREWLTAALDHAEGLPDEVLAKVLHGLGTVTWSMGEMVEAEGYFEQSLTIWRRLGDKRGIANMLNNIGIILQPMGKYKQARERHSEGLRLYRELGDGWSIALSLANLGLVALDSGEYAEAEKLLQESLAVRREVGDEQGIAQSLNNLGMVARCVGDLERSCALHKESLEMFRRMGDRRSMGLAMSYLANALLDSGSPEARTYLLDSLALFKESGVRTGMASSFEGLAQLASKDGEWKQAALLFGVAERMRDELKVGMFPFNRSGYARWKEQTFSELGADEFNAAYLRGRSLGIEEAFALVR